MQGVSSDIWLRVSFKPARSIFASMYKQRQHKSCGISRGVLQTESEYFWSFGERLLSMVRKAFPARRLYFVTFQPVKGICLSAAEVERSTAELFGQIPFIMVSEQTFKVSRFSNSADYTENWHSHLIIDEAGVNSLPDDLDQFHDVVIKPVFDLSGLVGYLSKQGAKNRRPPLQHTPDQVTGGSGVSSEPSEVSTLSALPEAYKLMQLLTQPPKTPAYTPVFCSTSLQKVKHRPFLPNCPPDIGNYLPLHVLHDFKGHTRPMHGQFYLQRRTPES